MKTVKSRIKTANTRLFKKSVQRVGGSRWHKFRTDYLNHNPMCKLCFNKGLVVIAHEVDHIVPLIDGGKEFDERNLQSLCIECHKEKTANENRARFSFK